MPTSPCSCCPVPADTEPCPDRPAGEAHEYDRLAEEIAAMLDEAAPSLMLAACEAVGVDLEPDGRHA